MNADEAGVFCARGASLSVAKSVTRDRRDSGVPETSSLGLRLSKLRGARSQ
jgi:hypothetical protein